MVYFTKNQKLHNLCFYKIHLSQYFTLLITHTNMSLSVSMTSKAAPPTMGQWPGANINVVLGCMGTDGTVNHG